MTANSLIFATHAPDAEVHWARRPADGVWFTRKRPYGRNDWSDWMPSLRPDPDVALGNTGRTARLPH